MANQNFKNRLSQPFIKNSKRVFGLPLGGKIRRGMVVLSGTVVVSGGTTNGTVIGDGGPLNLIEHIYVVATPGAGSRYPGGKIVDSDPRSLMRNAVTQRSGKWFSEQSGSTLGGGAAGTYDIYQAVPIYWADAVQRNSIATALNTDGAYASVQVEVDTADLASCFDGNDRVVDYSGLNVEWVDYRVAVPGDTAVLYQEAHDMLIAATNKRALDEAMPQDGNFLSWQILAEKGADRTLSDQLFNRMVASSPTLDLDLYAQDIRQTCFDDEWFDPALDATGMYFQDFTDGVLTANSVPAGSLQLYMDVTNVSGANLDALKIFTRRIYQPAPAPSGSTGN